MRLKKKQKDFGKKRKARKSFKEQSFVYPKRGIFRSCLKFKPVYTAHFSKLIALCPKYYNITTTLQKERGNMLALAFGIKER